MKRYMIKRTTKDGETMYLSTIYSASKFDWTSRTAFAHRFVSTSLASKWLYKLYSLGYKVELVEA